MKIKEIDITTAYLNGYVEEQTFMEAPDYLEDVLEHMVQSRREG